MHFGDGSLGGKEILMPKDFKIDKTNFLDDKGRYRTQSLFLETKYAANAVYSVTDRHRMYKGKFYPSLKQLYLEFEDLLEIEFAKKYFLGWAQWKKICANKLYETRIVKWREELELQVRSSAVRTIIDMAGEDRGGFQANKWLADKGWVQKQPGRPSKESVQEELEFRANIEAEFKDDVSRLAKLH